MYPPFAKLDNLTLAMLSPQKPSAKLRCYGSECHGLIPVARHMAEELLSGSGGVEQTVRQATFELAVCCDAESKNLPMADHSRRFVTLWVALEAAMSQSFRIKPKLHFL